MPIGWCPFALQLPGPEAKTGYSGRDRIHAKVGCVLHTAEYDVKTWDEKVLYNALFSDREASWHFTITKEGWLFQHYQGEAVTWHAGYQGNLWLVGIELEGISPTKLTGPQYELLVKLLRWIKEEHHWGMWRGIGDKRSYLGVSNWAWLFEHNAVPGAPATNCAVFTNGQIDPQRLLRDLRQEEDVTSKVYCIKGRPEDYVLTNGGTEWEHIPDRATFLRLGYKAEDVIAFPATDPIWDKPVKYSKGIPGPLRS